VVVPGLDPPFEGPIRTFDLEAIRELLRPDPYRPKVVHQSFQAIALLDPQLTGTPDPGDPGGSRGEDRDSRNLVQEPGDLIRGDVSAVEIHP
jgi:hypothetical protein